MHRRAPLMLGMILILAALILARNLWSTVVVVDDRRQAFDQIQVGMEREQVESLLGEKGKFRWFGGSEIMVPGSKAPTALSIVAMRWEDADETVDVQFRGSEVETISRRQRESSYSGSLLQARIGLALLATIGLVFLFEGVRSHPNRSPATAVSSTSSTA